MSALTITDLNNGKTDLDHIKDFATSTELTVTDRLGHVKKSIAGFSAEAQAAILENTDLILEAGSVATTQAGISTAQAALAADAAIAAQSAQTAGAVGFADAAAMNADLLWPDKTVAELFDTGEHYRKSGASGSGSWIGPNTAPTAATSLAVANRALDRRESIGRGAEIPNLFSVVRAILGQYIQADGTLAVDATRFASDPMPVRAGNTYTYSRAVAHRAWYSDAAGTVLIGAVAAVAAAATETAPAGAITARVSQVYSNLNDARIARLMVSPGSASPSQYQAGGVENPQSSKRTATLAGRAAAREISPRVGNIFSKLAATADFALVGGNGVPYATAGWYVTPLISVDPGLQFISNKSSGASGASQYDEDGRWLRDFTVTAGTAVTMPTDAFAFRQQVNGLINKDTHMVAEGNTLPSSYVAFASVPTLVTDVAAAVAAVASLNARQPARPNLFDIRSCKDGFALSNANGAEYAAAGSFYNLTPCDVTPGQQLFITMHNAGTNAALLVWKDSVGAFVSAANQAMDSSFTVPAGAYRLQITTTALRRKHSIHVSVGTTRPAGYRPFGLTGDRPKQDAQVALLGDSFSEYVATNGGWTPYFVNLTGSSIIFNYAKAGRATRDALKDSAGVVLTASSFDNVTDTIIQLGTNDYGGNRAIGTLADASDAYAGAGSFYNDVYVVLKTLYGWKPEMRVTWWTPTIRGDVAIVPTQPIYPAANGAGVTLPQYVQAIKDVCQLFGTPVLDLFSNSGFNLLNLSVVTNDNLHPSDPIGQQTLGRAAGRMWNAV